MGLSPARLDVLSLQLSLPSEFVPQQAGVVDTIQYVVVGKT